MLNHSNLLRVCGKLPIVTLLTLTFSQVYAGQSDQQVLDADERELQALAYKDKIKAISSACVQEARLKFSKKEDKANRRAFIQKCRAKHLSKNTQTQVQE